MPKLNDTQRIMLSAAAQREDRSLYPLSQTIKAPNSGKIIASLLARHFAEECETSDPARVYRGDGDIRYGVFATTLGIAAIDGLDENAAPSTAAKPERETKSATVVALLEREQGAMLTELMAATGWLPHSTRAALTGLRKKGHAIERSKRDDDTCYCIVKAA